MTSQPTSTAVDDERITDFGLIVEAYARLLGAFERSFKAECDLTSPVFELLLRLARSPDQQLAMGELAEQLAITSGGVTRLIDRVIDAGYVERKPCPTDRRVHWVTLTTTGQAKTEAAVALHVNDLQRELHDRLTPADLKHLRTIMDKLRQPTND